MDLTNDGQIRLVHVSETRLRKLLDEAAEKAVRRALKGARKAAEDRPGKKYLTGPELQDYTGWSKATVARRRADGTLPYSKIGQRCFYSLEEVHALIEAGRQER